MHMEVKYVLSGCFAALLNDADAVSVGDLFNCSGNLFNEFVNFAYLVFGNVEDVNVMLFWNNKRVSLV